MSEGFSVVIPAYNYGHCVERAVRSVLNQSCTDFEVIVINDGSTDDTDVVMRRIQESGAEPLRYIYQENRGVSAVRNRGIDESRYPWLVFLDADDEMCPGALAELQQCALKYPGARLLIGGHLSCFDSECVNVEAGPVFESRKKNLLAYLSKRLGISNGACAMHRNIFDGVRYDSDLHHTEDIPVFAHALANYPAAMTTALIARIHKHADSRRHDVEAALKVGISLESAIFENNGLPDWALGLRKPYRIRRILSLLKLCDRGGRYREVRWLYVRLFRESPVDALKPRYLRRYFKSFLKV